MLIRSLRLMVLFVGCSICHNTKSNSTNLKNSTDGVNDTSSKISVTRLITETTERIQFRNNETVIRTRYVPNVIKNSTLADEVISDRMKGRKYDGLGNEMTKSVSHTPEKYISTSCRYNTKTSKYRHLDNNTYTVKNGKTYRIIKIPRSEKCRMKNTSNGEQIQRRTFNTANFNSIIPNFSSYFPIQWMTKKEGKNDSNEIADNLTEDKNSNFWSKLNPMQTKKQEEIKPKIPAAHYPGEKVKKFLNLFTIVKFDNGGCYANGLKGTCYHQIECQARGGRAIGSCAKGFGICCYIEKSCGERTRENCTYFVNEGFPKPSTNAPKVCALTVDKADPGVQQLRLDFQTFELRGPVNGTCLTDRFIVTGQNTNDIVPDICGINTGQHIYVDVDDSKGPFNLNVITMGPDLPRTFRIKVTQLKKDDELLAPKNCLQYYTEPSNVIQTFNYQYGNIGNLPEALPGYFNNLNYVICMKKNAGFCTITYENEERAGVDPTFQLVNVDEEGESLVPPLQGGAEIFNCPDDFIIVNGIRLCGERLNDASIEVDYTRNFPVTERSNGPFILPVRTNEAVTGRGFSLTYKQNPCMS